MGVWDGGFENVQQYTTPDKPIHVYYRQWADDYKLPANDYGPTANDYIPTVASALESEL